MPEQGDDTEEDHDCDGERAERVGDVPAELLDEEGGDDDADGAQGVGKDVQVNAGHVVVGGVGGVAVWVAVACVRVGVRGAVVGWYAGVGVGVLEGEYAEEVHAETGEGDVLKRSGIIFWQNVNEALISLIFFRKFTFNYLKAFPRSRKAEKG